MIGSGFTAHLNSTLSLVELTPIAPVLRAQPQDRAAKLNRKLQLTARAKGFPEPWYQWFFNGIPIEYETRNTFTLWTTTEADAGAYFVVAQNFAGSVTSRVATVTVEAPAL